MFRSVWIIICVAYRYECGCKTWFKILRILYIPSAKIPKFHPRSAHRVTHSRVTPLSTPLVGAHQTLVALHVFFLLPWTPPQFRRFREIAYNQVKPLHCGTATPTFFQRILETVTEHGT